MPSVSVPVPHLFTVDVEEYFQVNAFESVVPRERWPEYPSRLATGVDALLDLLAAHGTRGTFFVLGWCARHSPAVVRRIADAGHEVASHGYWHRRVTTLTPQEFRDDLRMSRTAIEDLTGQRVLGYRAPSFSIVPGGEWALDVLAEEGFVYDSSLFPIRRRGYGYPSASPRPAVLERPAGALLEMPLATTTLFGRRLPAAGGGYLRQLPLMLIQRAFREHTQRGEPATLYIHPWEVDPGQPRLPVSAVTRIRHYRGLSSTMSRLATLLAEFRFTDIRSQLDRYLPAHMPPRAASPELVAR
jgi:polysaccharide deacetylase family protein (PEP-CTERM system associated)